MSRFWELVHRYNLIRYPIIFNLYTIVISARVLQRIGMVKENYNLKNIKKGICHGQTHKGVETGTTQGEVETNLKSH